MLFLSKIEDVFVQVIRLVLLAFSVLVLIALGMHLLEKTSLNKSSSSANSTVTWSDVKPDMQFVVEETGRDMGLHVSDTLLQERLTDAQLRPAFKQVDQLLRDFVAQKAQQHARTEADNQSRGLAPINPLLAGDTVPTTQEVAAFVKAQQDKAQAEQDRERVREESLERMMAASDEAQAQAIEAAEATTAAVSADEEECCWTDPVDTAQVLHDRAMQAQLEHGDKAYAAFVSGAPAAMELVLNDATLAPKLHELTVSRLLDMVMTNYSISFSRAVSEQDSSSENLWDSVFSSIELTMWSVILSFLVLVVFVVMMIRMERHLRAISLHTTAQH